MGSGSWKVRLRLLVENDLPLVYAWRQDKQVMRYLPTAPVEPSWAEHQAWFAGRDGLYFVIEYDQRPYATDSGFFLTRPIGIVHWKRDGEVGVIIGERDLWGKGLAKEALRMMLSYLPSGCPVWCVVHPKNERSMKLFEGLGFTKTEERGRNGQVLLRRAI